MVDINVFQTKDTQGVWAEAHKDKLPWFRALKTGSQGLVFQPAHCLLQPPQYFFFSYLGSNLLSETVLSPDHGCVSAGVCLCERLIVIGNLFIHSFIEQIFPEQLLCAGSLSGIGIQWLQAGDHEMAAVKGTHDGTPVRKNQLG